MSQISINLTKKQDLSLNPQNMTSTRFTLTEITSDMRLWEQICAFSRLNIELLGSLVDMLSDTVDDWFINRQAFRTLRTEIRLICSAQGRLSSHITERFERITREFELFRGIKEFSELRYVALDPSKKSLYTHVTGDRHSKHAKTLW